MPRPTGISTVGDLRRAVADGSVPRRDVHQEVRENLIRKLRAGEPLFPGIVGYDDTVVPQLVNALLSQHNSSCSASAARRRRAPARARDAARRGDPGDAGVRNQRRPARSHLRRVPRAARGGRRHDAVAWLGRDLRTSRSSRRPT